MELGDEQSFLLSVGRLEQADGPPALLVGPEPLALALEVVGNQGAGRLQNRLRRAVVLFQPDDPSLRVVHLEIQDVANVRAAPAVDRLVLVSHHAQVLPELRQQPHQFVLGPVGVLILVDHQVLEAPVVGFAYRLVVLEQPDGFEQEIVEIERGRLPQAVLVLFVHHRQAGCLRVGRALVEVRRSLLPALRLADLRRARRGTP